MRRGRTARGGPLDGRGGAPRRPARTRGRAAPGLRSGATMPSSRARLALDARERLEASPSPPAAGDSAPRPRRGRRGARPAGRTAAPAAPGGRPRPDHARPRGTAGRATAAPIARSAAAGRSPDGSARRRRGGRRGPSDTGGCALRISPLAAPARRDSPARAHAASRRWSTRSLALRARGLLAVSSPLAAIGEGSSAREAARRRARGRRASRSGPRPSGRRSPRGGPRPRAARRACGSASAQRLELVVDGHAQRLEGARGHVGAMRPGGARHRALDRRHQLGRRSGAERGPRAPRCAGRCAGRARSSPCSKRMRASSSSRPGVSSSSAAVRPSAGIEAHVEWLVPLEENPRPDASS